MGFISAIFKLWTEIVRSHDENVECDKDIRASNKYVHHTDEIENFYLTARPDLFVPPVSTSVVSVITIAQHNLAM